MSHPSLWDPISVGEIDKAADQFGIVKGSDGVTRRMPAEEILDRLLSSDDLSWMPAFANFAALASGDGFLVLDEDASAVNLLPSSAVMNRLLSSTDLSWMSSLANLAAVSGANDAFLLLDASDGVIKTLTANEILARLLGSGQVTANTGNATLTNAVRGSIQTNRGASGLITLTSWAPAAGDEITVGRRADYPLRFKPPGGSQVEDIGSGKYIELRDRGDVRLRCEEDLVWEVAAATAHYAVEH